MGILKSIKDKFSKKPKLKILSDKELASLCLEYCDEVKLLSHAVDVSKTEDKEFFAARTDKYIQTYPKLLEDIELAKAYAQAGVDDFIETGDDILAHNSQEYYDDLLADWMASPILIQMAENRLNAAYIALCQLKAHFEQSQDYDKELIEKIAKDTTTYEQMKRKSKMQAQGQVSAMEVNNPFALSKETLSSIGKGAALGTMVSGVLTANPLITAVGATAYHASQKHENERE